MRSNVDGPDPRRAWRTSLQPRVVSRAELRLRTTRQDAALARSRTGELTLTLELSLA